MEAAGKVTFNPFSITKDKRTAMGNTKWGDIELKVDGGDAEAS